MEAVALRDLRVAIDAAAATSAECAHSLGAQSSFLPAHRSSNLLKQ